MAGACAAIPGANGATYSLVTADVGATVRHVVTATNAGGSAVARSTPSPAIATAPTTAATPPSNTAPPTISGTPTVGQTLSATAGTWTGSTPMSYARGWERCVAGSCTEIAGATAATYTLASADLGATIRHVVTATNAAGSAVSRSTQTAAVLSASPTAPVNTAPPTVTGTAAVGQVLTATTGTWAGSTPMAFAQAWERCFAGRCTPISGAATGTYTVVTADVGSTLLHSVTATNTVGSAVARSTQTAAVPSAPAAPASTVAPAVTGTAAVGQVLSATTGTWTGSTPMAFARAWERCVSGTCTPIAGATAGTYTVALADVGATLRHAVTASNTVGTAVARSTQTTAVQAPAQPAANLGTALPTRMPESAGTNYYVDGSRGSDSNPGTLTAPWRTIEKAFSSVGLSGSIINVRAGTYQGQHQFIGRYGNASNPITLQPYPGEHVHLTAPAGEHALLVYRGGGIRIRGFEVTTPAGIDGIKIESARDVEVVDCEIHHTGGQGILVAGTGTSPATTSNVQIWNNRFHDNGGDPTFYDHSVYWGAVSNNFDGVDHTIYGGVIANNLFYNQPTGRQLQIGSQADGLIVTNNTFYRPYATNPYAGSAVQFYGEGTPYDTRNVVVVNNLITYSAKYGVHGSGGGGLMSTNLVRNNLAYGNANTDFLSYWGSTDRILFQLGPNITGQNPLFANPGGADFRLQAGSPAIGKADPAYAPPNDFDGRARSGTPDLGAYEH